MKTKFLVLLSVIFIISLLTGCDDGSNTLDLDTNTGENLDNSQDVANSEDNEEYVMGILPLHNPTVMLERFAGVEAYLKEKTGKNIKLKFYPTEGELGGYTQVVKEITSGDIHFAYLAPVTFVQANGVNDAVVPFACAQKGGSPTYMGNLVVLADSPYQSLEDLEGKKVTGTSMSSTSGNLFPSALLIEKGIDKETYFDGGMQYLGAHDKAVEAVLAGVMDGAFINEATFFKYNTDNQLRSIWQHDPVAEFPFVVNTEVVDAEVLAEVKSALLNMHQDDLEGVQAVNGKYEKWVSIGVDDYASAKKACDFVHGEELYNLETWGQ